MMNDCHYEGINTCTCSHSFIPVMTLGPDNGQRKVVHLRISLKNMSL